MFMKSFQEEFVDGLPPTFQLNNPDTTWDSAFLGIAQKREDLRASIYIMIAGLYRVFINPNPLDFANKDADTFPTNTLIDRVILITDANSEIGLEAARKCAKLNAKSIILAMRDIRKGFTAKEGIYRPNPGFKGNIEVWDLEMESFELVLLFGHRIQFSPFSD